MRRDDGAATRGQVGEQVPDFGVKRFDLGHVRCAITVVGAGVLRIGLGQRRCYVVDVGHRMLEALPGMGVGGAMVMAVMAAVVGFRGSVFFVIGMAGVIARLRARG